MRIFFLIGEFALFLIYIPQTNESSKTTEIYTHITEKSLLKITNHFDDL